MRKQHFFYILSLLVVVLMCVLSCGEPVPVNQLIQTDFELKLPEGAPEDLIKLVVDLEIDKYGNLYVIDPGASSAFKFDPKGNYVYNYSNTGAGNYDRMVGIETVDSSVVLHTHEMISFHLPDGRHAETLALEGAGTLSVSENGVLLINRSMDAHIFGQVLEIYDEKLNMVQGIRNARAEFQEDQYRDFGFADFISDTSIVYLQAYSDSAFIYDTDGTLKLAKKLKTTAKPYTHNESDQAVYFDDMAVAKDGIYVARIDLEKTTDELVYINRIEKYDFNLNLTAAYELPESITMTVRLLPWIPSYHKFQVFQGMFYFFTSGAKNTLSVYAVKTAE